MFSFLGLALIALSGLMAWAATQGKRATALIAGALMAPVAASMVAVAADSPPPPPRLRHNITEAGR